MNYMYLERLPSNKVLRLTKSGLDGLKHRLDVLTAERRTMYAYVQNAVKERQDLNDLVTHEKIKELERDDKELYKILQVLEYATVVSRVEEPTSVDIGLTVTLRNDQGKTCEYTVVCPLEVDPEHHKISDESPLGQLLMGKKVGDAFDIISPKGGKNAYSVINIK